MTVRGEPACREAYATLTGEQRGAVQAILAAHDEVARWLKQPGKTLARPMRCPPSRKGSRKQHWRWPPPPGLKAEEGPGYGTRPLNTRYHAPVNRCRLTIPEGPLWKG